MSMSQEYVNVASKAKSGTASSTMTRFHAQSHFWGRLTILLVMLASVGLPMYLSFVLGAHPGWGAIFAGLIGYAAFIGVLWIVEPVTYFPILGIGGTYIAFLSGNIANLCVPCSSAAQKAVGAELGTEKAEIAGVLGIALASLTNTIVIILTVLGGTFIVNLIPESIQASFVFVLPAIFGAVLGQFAFSKPKYGAMAVLIGIAVFFSPIPSLLKIASCVAISIAIIYNLEKAKDKKADA